MKHIINTNLELTHLTFLVNTALFNYLSTQ
jgi:hypothetical protein